MPESKKAAFCGFAVNQAGQRKVIAAGGWSRSPSRVTFVYDVDTDTWINNGPQFPKTAAFNGMTVPYQDGFLCLSGNDGSLDETVFDKNIYWFNPQSFRFETVLSTKLRANHFFGTAFIMEDAFYDCSSNPLPITPLKFD